MSDTIDQLRAAFDGDDIPRKNIALRKAHDEIERLMADRIELMNWLNTHYPYVAIAFERWRRR